ncbi:MAG: carbohydrate kinase [Clostridiales bacterium]|nr:carbohydrate kinase [Clostridiales bacterium]
MRVLSFGEILWDVYPDNKYIGGAPLNFAAHFVKQGGGAYMVSSLGNDELGQMALKDLDNWKINTDFVNILPGIQTGKCLVKLDESRLPSYDLLSDVAYDHIECQIKGKEFDALYFGTLALRSRNNLNCLSELMKNNEFKEIFVDINIRPPFYSIDTIRFAFEHATIMKISDEELPIITKCLFNCDSDYSTATKLLSKEFGNLKMIVVTRGENGSYAYDCRSGKSYISDAQKVNVVSTVGAGDSFSAAFMYNYLSGKDIDECLKKASKLSAFVVSQKDAIPEY